MFSKKDIETYYNHTLLHYKVGWQLDKSKGLHYGLWYDDTKNLDEAIQNTNKKIGEYIGSPIFNVLDAGCGVGGTAIFLAKEFGCKVKGITLSPVQYRQGKKYIQEAKLENKIELSIQDYSKTSFEDESFDLVFGIESFCHANEKSDVYNEAFRLLKPGGYLLIIDSIKTDKGRKPENRKTIEWLLNRWAISDLDDERETFQKLKKSGFENILLEDLTMNAKKSIHYIYQRAFFGLITIPIYLLLFPTKYQYSRRHPESGWALKKCFRKKLIEYVFVSAKKPTK